MSDLMASVEEFRKKIGMTPVVAADVEEEEEPLGEYKAAEYIIFSLALETYLRHLGETVEFRLKQAQDRRDELLQKMTFESDPSVEPELQEAERLVSQLEALGDSPVDKVSKMGIVLLRRLDQELESLQSFIDSQLERDSQKKMLDRTFRRSARNAQGAERRALGLRTLLRDNRVVRGVFESAQARKQVKTAIAAQMMSDGDAALDLFAAMPASVIKNPLIRKWIKLAADTAKPLPSMTEVGLEVEEALPKAAPNPIVEATSAAVEQTPNLMAQQAKQEGATGVTEVQDAQAAQGAMLQDVQQKASEAARQTMERQGEPDIPPAKSEVVGIATAAAVAAMSDPANPQNIPETLKKLDPEQRAAAVTDGRVLVAAGAGAGKCIKGDTLVRTFNGLRSIQELAGDLQADQSIAQQNIVLGLNGPEPTSTILNNGTRETVVLTTRLGYRIEGTLVHPLFVLRDMQLQWVPMGEITQDDVICIDRRPGMFSEVPFRVPPRTFRKVTNSKPTRIPEEITQQVASMLGYIVSEGHVVYGQHSVVGLSTTDPEQRRLYEASLDGVVDWSTLPLKMGWRTDFCCRSNLEALADFGMTYALAGEKEIPSGILQSPRPIIVSFLRALFDGDGGFYRSEIYYDSASEKLARQVQELLLSFGCISRLKLRPNDHLGCWHVSLTGEDARIFLREIGFNLKSKQQAAETALIGLSANPNLDVVPGVPGLFRAVLDHARSQGQHITKHPKYGIFKDYANGSRCPSHRMLQEFVDAYPGDTEAHCSLQVLAQSPWFYDTVDSLEPSRADVYDFIVPGTHSFSAGGFVNHNSTTLVARVNHLVRDRGVPPSRILVTSFNTSAAEELKVKLGKATGGDAASSMQVGTMHSLFKRFLLKYGNAQEKQAMRTPDPGKAASLVARTVQGIWGSCFDKDDMPTPPLKEVKQQMELWVGNNISVAEAKATAKNRKQVIAAQWYEMYEGLKGALPGWEPPCEEKARNAAEEEYQEKYRRWEAYGGRGRPPQKPMTSYEWFMSKARPNGEQVGDFNDMIRMFRDLLKRNPAVRKEVQSLFDHILVDECQDLNGVQNECFQMMTEHIGDGSDGRSVWMVGDDKQCVASDTLVSTPTGEVAAGSLRPDMTVLSYRNGDIVPQKVRYAKPSSWTWGYKITTESGKTLTMSPNHKIWASQPVVEDGQKAVYLMYRPDMGFRVGVTNKGYDEDYYNSFGGRAFMEKAERMWILEVCPDQDSALLAEIRYSLKYGIPTMVFGGENRGINQDRVDAIFKEFGGNGGRLLEDRYLNFDLPHWMSRSYSKHGRVRRTIQMIAHASGNTQVSLEWAGDDLDGKLAGLGVSFTRTARTNRIRRYFANYREALSFAESLRNSTEANLCRRLSTPDGSLGLVTASALFPGMNVAVVSDSRLITETVTSVEKVEGLKFVDLDVEDASNFFGGKILSHNSIYGFRGARPDLFQGLYEQEGWTTRMIRTNYRCAPEIIEHANRLIANNERQIPMAANAAPGRIKGEARLEVTTPADAETGAIETVKRILEAKASNPMTANSEFAVLARTNKELHAYEAACLIQGIPYARKGASSFLGTPEVKGMLGYVDLVMGTDNEKLQKSLADVINIPRRFWGLDMEQSERAVKDAIRDYARKMRIDPKAINPVEALRDRSFQEMLGQRLGAGPSGSAKYKDVMSQLETLIDFVDNMQASSAQPGFEVKDLFNEVLLIEGKVREINPDTGRAEFKTRTFRDSIQVSTRDRDDGDEVEAADDEEGEDTSGLGNISFLYELAKVDPNNPPDLEEDPSKPGGFLRKMDQLREKAKDLRINVEKWNAEQRDVPPDKRVPPPGVYLGTAHCSPADEPVLTTEGYVPIGDLDPDRHRLASYLPTCNQLFWGRIKGYHEGPDGYGFQKSSRPYQGPLLTLTTDRSRTRVTPDHKLRVKFADNFFNKWVVYLMRRGDWWRVGMCRSANRPYKSGDLGCRLSTEKADGGWILKVCETREETIAEEARIQGIYGIPGLTFEASKQRTLTSAQLHVIHEKVKSQVGERVSKLLSDFGLDAEHPLYIGGSGRECDKRSSFTTQARNCLSGYMTLPVVSEAFVQGTGHREIWTKPEWHEVQVTTEQFEGDVYSLVVAPHRFYVSGGAVVHNSVKGAQWPTVFVQMPAGKFPMEPRRDPKDPPPTEEELAEQMEQERRLAYVALTRAATNLSVVCPRKIGNAGGISSFVEEAGLSTYMVSPPKPESAPPPPESAEPEVLAEPEAVLKEASQWNPFEDGAHWDPFGE